MQQKNSNIVVHGSAVTVVFKPVEFDRLRAQAGINPFSLAPQLSYKQKGLKWCIEMDYSFFNSL